jgi:hypothetical protein
MNTEVIEAERERLAKALALEMRLAFLELAPGDLTLTHDDFACVDAAIRTIAVEVYRGFDGRIH